MGSIVSMVLLLPNSRGRFPDGPDFLGEVDAHGAPGDTASAAHTTRTTELVDPGGQLVGQPLAVTRPGRGADAAAVQIGEIHAEAGVQTPPPFPRHAGQVKSCLLY